MPLAILFLDAGKGKGQGGQQIVVHSINVNSISFKVETEYRKSLEMEDIISVSVYKVKQTMRNSSVVLTVLCIHFTQHSTCTEPLVKVLADN